MSAQSPPPSPTPPRALVTGGNRGLGREVCRQLAARGWHVLLAARDGAAADREAVALNAALSAALRTDPRAKPAHTGGTAGGTVIPVVLDVAEPRSVQALAAQLAQQPPLAALVNNAGVALDGFDADVVRRTLAVNLHGALALADALTAATGEGASAATGAATGAGTSGGRTDPAGPRLAPQACVVMVSSGLGALSGLGATLRKRLLAPELDRAGLAALAAEFQAAVEHGRERREGWPRSAYNVSKALLNAATRLLAREWGAAGCRVNAVCPGWVRTDMGGQGASRSVSAGARGIVWAATLPPNGPTGGFFRDGQPIDW